MRWDLKSVKKKFAKMQIGTRVERVKMSTTRFTTCSIGADNS